MEDEQIVALLGRITVALEALAAGMAQLLAAQNAPRQPPPYLDQKWPRLAGDVYDNTPHGPIPSEYPPRDLRTPPRG